MQPPQPQYTSPVTPSPQPPAPTRTPRWLVWLVVGVVGVVVVGAALALVVVPYLAQPKVTLTAATYSTSGCAGFGPDQWTYTWTFTLVNTGNANGFATVEFYLNGQPNVGTYSTIVYLVPQGSQVTEQTSVQSADCGSYSPGATIISVDKA